MKLTDKQALKTYKAIIDEAINILTDTYYKKEMYHKYTNFLYFAEAVKEMTSDEFFDMIKSEERSKE